jgi:hypothetical protein
MFYLLVVVDPPDDAWFKIFTQFGSSGLLLAGLAWLVRYYMADAEKQRQEVQNRDEEWRKQVAESHEASQRLVMSRLELAEKRLDACETDRATLHKQFADMLLKLTHPTS